MSNAWRFNIGRIIEFARSPYLSEKNTLQLFNLRWMFKTRTGLSVCGQTGRGTESLQCQYMKHVAVPHRVAELVISWRLLTLPYPLPPSCYSHFFPLFYPHNCVCSVTQCGPCLRGGSGLVACVNQWQNMTDVFRQRSGGAARRH